MLRIGRYELYSIVTGAFRLDGGAMFGVVPKVLWGNVVEFDEANRIYLTTRTLLAVDRDEKRVILTDTGCGTKWSKEHAARFAIVHDPDAIPNALSAIRLSVDDVTDIVVTHLHFDHNGGLTEWFDDPGGRTVVKYPRARHWIHRRHWVHALHPHPKDKASFLPEDFLVLEDAGVLQFIEEEHPRPLLPGLSVFISHGHTPFQLHPIFASDEEELIWTGDLVPTVAHLRLLWVMAYDLTPETTIEEKTAMFERALGKPVTLAFPHDPQMAAARIDGKPERPIVSHIADL